MLRSRLLNIMQRELEAQSLQLPPSCRAQIQQMVGRGITRMKMSRVLDDPGRILQAERNVKKLVKYFAECSRKAGSFPVLSESDFSRAMVKCPTIWPYLTAG